jgi:hypothetical protein
LFFFETGGKKISKPDNGGNISPALFMMLRNEDLFEGDVAGVEESTIVRQTSHSHRQPHLHSHTIGFYRLLSPSGRLAGAEFRDAKENEV